MLGTVLVSRLAGFALFCVYPVLLLGVAIVLAVDTVSNALGIPTHE